MSTNNAAYLVATKAPVEIKPAPYPSPADDEIVVKTRAIAINPVDHAIQELGPDYFKFITLPCILGYDVAGEVEVVGAGVTTFKPGDRVAGFARGGFQAHVPLAAYQTVSLPDTLSWAQAAVLPMGVSVATKALFHEDLLAMRGPSREPSAKGETVLIWGGSTSVGTCAIQLAAAAGYEVITTASPHNFDLVKKLGASEAFDYNSPTIKEDLLAAFQGKTVAGAVANAGLDREGYPQIVDICAEVVKSSPGKKMIAMTMVPVWGPAYDGLGCKFVETLGNAKQLGSSVFHAFLPDALAQGSFQPSPQAKVVGTGLESVQEAMDILKSGVSAQKIVVTL